MAIYRPRRSFLRSGPKRGFREVAWQWSVGSRYDIRGGVAWSLGYHNPRVSSKGLWTVGSGPDPTANDVGRLVEMIQTLIGFKISLGPVLVGPRLVNTVSHLVYTSMSPIVHIVNVGSATTESLANEIHEGLDFVSHDYRGYSFGLFSVKFSTDGRELVAGSSDNSIYVYDLDSNKLSLRIAAHTGFTACADVNTVTFADEGGNLIYSGSDDNLCKVWDRRCFIAKDKPAGVLMGHLEGITFIDSRGDDRYFISNGKDQTIKLWDIRKMSSNTSWVRNYEWDYRWMDYPPQARDFKHPCDQSVATYKGHSVLRTLIRCYFSPEQRELVLQCGNKHHCSVDLIRVNCSDDERLYAPQFLEGVLRKQTMRGGACIPCMETSAEKRLNLGASPTNVNSSRLLGPFKLGSFTFTYTLLWIVFIIHRLSI
ncbi:LEC14B-like protein [Hibiscus syriacus]|uniref:LEC14B-like protein n=1 Tax=Hibiscus syriacus TaxID=106335 RepID=A0A6A2Z232_HIBSY|nr:LEC14B-like protein [Hibiscus syriacus]